MHYAPKRLGKDGPPESAESSSAPLRPLPPPARLPAESRQRQSAGLTQYAEGSPHTPARQHHIACVRHIALHPQDPTIQPQSTESLWRQQRDVQILQDIVQTGIHAQPPKIRPDQQPLRKDLAHRQGTTLAAFPPEPPPPAQAPNDRPSHGPWLHSQQLRRYASERVDLGAHPRPATGY
ncbi:MAG: hypothetical protein Q8O31_00020 [Rhodocyclaceae bacterium]|nr:hypothetical protein [Rhodocyclaceae bacterium]